MSVRDQYLAKMTEDLAENSASLQKLNTIFIGGGTPSQLSPTELETLMKSIRSSVTLNEGYEFTVEINPGTISKEKLQVLKDYGVNRLSYGGQTTTRKIRSRLGHRTTHEQLLDAVRMSREVGFDNLNIDLIYGVPGQTLEDWEGDLKELLSLDLKHFSAYSLILEEGSVLSERYSEVDDDLAVDMYHMTEDYAQKFGLSRYEVSNYSQPGFECRHNFDIWLGASYLGIGPAASSFDGVDRWNQIADLKKWLLGTEADYDRIEPFQRACEVMIFGLRTMRGWKESELQSLFAKDVFTIEEFPLVELIDEGLLVRDAGYLRPTEEGLLFADTVAEALLV